MGSRMIPPENFGKGGSLALAVGFARAAMADGGQHQHAPPLEVGQPLEAPVLAAGGLPMPSGADNFPEAFSGALPPHQGAPVNEPARRSRFRG